MKKFHSALALLLLAFLSYFPISAESYLMDNVGISLYAGAAVPVVGDYTQYDKITDLLALGPHFGLGLSYYFTEQLGIEGSFHYEFNYFKVKYRFAGTEPVRTQLYFLAGLIYYFDEMLSEKDIRPFARAGIGLYNWAFREDGLASDASTNAPGGFKSTDFGINIGAGVDFKLLEDLTAGLVLDFNMYFPKDELKFGYFFAEQGTLSPRIKISYFIPTSDDY